MPLGTLSIVQSLGTAFDHISLCICPTISIDSLRLLFRLLRHWIILAGGPARIASIVKVRKFGTEPVQEGLECLQLLLLGFLQQLLRSQQPSVIDPVLLLDPSSQSVRCRPFRRRVMRSMMILLGRAIFSVEWVGQVDRLGEVGQSRTIVAIIPVNIVRRVRAKITTIVALGQLVLHDAGESISVRFQHVPKLLQPVTPFLLLPPGLQLFLVGLQSPVIVVPSFVTCIIVPPLAMSVQEIGMFAYQPALLPGLADGGHVLVPFRLPVDLQAGDVLCDFVDPFDDAALLVIPSL
mmetsp:Transcript_27036/g.64950  ORF Transcript_27036/g.64950 Transcript_27036/m.64950 type:complete len:293 (-) Transcript_27036:969-1847(-)